MLGAPADLPQPQDSFITVVTLTLFSIDQSRTIMDIDRIVIDCVHVGSLFFVFVERPRSVSHRLCIDQLVR